jgi:hypothetical protein
MDISTWLPTKTGRLCTQSSSLKEKEPQAGRVLALGVASLCLPTDWEETGRGTYTTSATRRTRRCTELGDSSEGEVATGSRRRSRRRKRELKKTVEERGPKVQRAGELREIKSPKKRDGEPEKRKASSLLVPVMCTNKRRREKGRVLDAAMGNGRNERGQRILEGGIGG